MEVDGEDGDITITAGQLKRTYKLFGPVKVMFSDPGNINDDPVGYVIDDTHEDQVVPLFSVILGEECEP